MDKAENLLQAMMAFKNNSGTIASELTMNPVTADDIKNHGLYFENYGVKMFYTAKIKLDPTLPFDEVNII